MRSEHHNFLTCSRFLTKRHFALRILRFLVHERCVQTFVRSLCEQFVRNAGLPENFFHRFLNGGTPTDNGGPHVFARRSHRPRLPFALRVLTSQDDIYVGMNNNCVVNDNAIATLSYGDRALVFCHLPLFRRVGTRSADMRV